MQGELEKAGRLLGRKLWYLEQRQQPKEQKVDLEIEEMVSLAYWMSRGQ